jgi:Flp pilus assembly pilin Flp
VIGRINVVAGQFLVDRWGFVKDRLRRETGQTFVEYSLVLLLVAVALVAGTFIDPFRDALSNALSKIGDVIQGVVDDDGGGGG